MSEAIRKAASVIAGRRAPGGFEMLVLERAASSRFLPGYVAFPGGSVDASDAALAERWFGTADEGPRACAVRELLEEIGLAVTSSGIHAEPSRALGEVDADPPPAGRLPEIAHWIAPEEVPVRFDARYFAVEAPAGLPLSPDGVETADAWWISAGDLLEAWRAGERRLYWPTFFTVSAIASCDTVDDLLALRIETREPNDEELERLPRSTFWQD